MTGAGRPLAGWRGAGVAVVLAVGACGGDAAPAGDGGLDAAPAGWSSGPSLPRPLSDNAVAALPRAGGCELYTVAGIEAGLDQAALTTAAFAWTSDQAGWRTLPAVPGPPRLAASAVGLRGRVYVVGGYTVSPTGAEASLDRVDVWDPAAAGWTTAAPLPVPIDDAVVAPWRDRYLLVVSGWSTTQPVRTVQLYDAEADAWTVADPFPGRPVFGHAGAISGDDVVIVDGVAAGAGGFALAPQAWRGHLDPASPGVIAWTDLGGHPGPGRYRAAAGVDRAGAVVIVGGTDEPYNFDGRAYATGQPSPPRADGLAYTRDGGFAAIADAPVATMDHRGLVGCGDALAVVGGLVAGPAVTDGVRLLRR
ncbi:MAG: hypothetical protein R3B06_29160 [Kofleriaceae bacterium]